MILNHETVGWISVVLSVISYIPYLRSMYKGTIKPHAFSWLIWAIMSAIAYFALVVSNAGPGAWIMGITTGFCILIAVYSMFVGEKDIKKSDWASFMGALLAIPAWYFTHDPLWAIVIVSIITILSYYPTIRKSWKKPYEEQIFMFLLSGIRFTLALFALDTYNLTTVLSHGVVAFMDYFFVLSLVYLRWKHKRLS